MPRGSPPGSNRGGGRPKGKLNKATIEKIKKAELAAAEAKASGRKLAKEVLEDFMFLFVGIAGRSQPFPSDRPQNPNYNEDIFEKYARLAVETAKDLAKYQSPQFRAIMVAPAPDTSMGTTRRRFTLQVFEHGGEPPPEPKMIDHDPRNGGSTSSSQH